MYYKSNHVVTLGSISTVHSVYTSFLADSLEITYLSFAGGGIDSLC